MTVIYSPIALVLLVALGLFIGQQAKKVSLLTLPVLFIALLVGVLLLRFNYVTTNFSLSMLVTAGVVGLSTVLYLKPPVWLSLMVVAIGGILLGLSTKPLLLPGFVGIRVYSTFAGVILGATGIWLAATGFTLVLKRFWEGVLVRALASWIVASVLMVVVLSFTKVLKL